MSAADRAVVRAARAFEGKSTARGVWAIGSTVALWAVVMWSMRQLGPGLASLMIPATALLHVRLFVLQHDCGHRSLFASRTLNDQAGRFLSMFSGLGHDAWRVEHDWHHQVTGRMDRRGVDRFNSPMTTDEARADPARAKAFVHKVKAWRIAWLGMLSLLVDRRRRIGFFVFRPTFVWRIDKRFVVEGIWLANLLQVLLHGALIALFGPVVWLTAMLPGVVLGAMIGGLLFWVQHNFEGAVIRPGDRWSFVEAAIRGSSYVRAPAMLRWFLADIGLHHVHHLNAHIPHYRLDEARLAIPALAAVPPLSFAQFRSAFTHHFFDPEREQRVPWEALGLEVQAPSVDSSLASSQLAQG